MTRLVAGIEQLKLDFSIVCEAFEAIASTPAQNIITDVKIFDKKSLQDHDDAVASGRQFGKQNLAELFIELKGK